MGFFDTIADIATVGAYGAVTGKGFDITGKGAAAQALKDSNAAQAGSAQNQLDLQQRMYDESVARNKPFYDTGVTANSERNKMVNGGYNMQESPAAQYELQQGTKSLNRQLAARGLLGSGNASQRLAELSSGIAANDYNQQYQRLSDQINTGTGAAQQSNQSSNQLAAQGTNTYQNQSNTTTSNNTARAQLYTGTSPLAVISDVAGAAGTLMGGAGKLKSSFAESQPTTTVATNPLG